MFDFESLHIYQKAKAYHFSIRELLKKNNADRYSKDQIIRASMSIMLNIAEGSGRNSLKDKRNFYIISRGSVFECVAILEILKHDGLINIEEHKRYYAESEELSKMLFAIIKKLEA